MKTQSIYRVRLREYPATKKRPRSFLLVMALIMACNMIFCSCREDGEPIDKPDEFTHVYQAKEKHALRAVYQIFRDKDLGKVTINEATQEVTSDYIVQGDWRTRSLARIRKVARDETEVSLSIITEKKTSRGWEMRRLLGKEQYGRFFDAIDTQIYREMSKPD